MPTPKPASESTESAPAVELEVGGKKVSGTIVSAAYKNLRLAFPAETARQVAVGQEVVLGIEGEEGQPAQVKGVVKLWRQADGEDHLRVEVAADQAAIVEEAFRRKRATRIGIQGERAVRVALETPKGDAIAEAALLNISERGLGLLVRFDGDRELAEGQKKAAANEAWLLHALLRLPGNADELRLVCRVVYRSSSAKCVKYGVQIDEERTRRAFPEQTCSVSEYMMCYQQSLLQTRAA